MTTTALHNKTLLLRDRLNQSIAMKLRAHQDPSVADNELPAPSWPGTPIGDVADRPAPAHTPQGAAIPEPESLAIDSDDDNGNGEKRFSSRKPTKLAGHICNEGSTIMTDVIIKDLSADGARFILDRGNSGAFSATPTIAEQFHLYITYDRMFVRCKLQWRNGDAFGVKYLAAPQFY